MEEVTSGQSGRNLCISDRLRQRRRRNTATTMTTSSEEEKKWSQQYSPTESAADARAAPPRTSPSGVGRASLHLDRRDCCRGWHKAVSATAWLNWTHRVVQSVSAGRKSRHSSPPRTSNKIMFCVRGSQSDRGRQASSLAPFAT